MCEKWMYMCLSVLIYMCGYIQYLLRAGVYVCVRACMCRGGSVDVYQIKILRLSQLTGSEREWNRKEAGDKRWGSGNPLNTLQPHLHTHPLTHRWHTHIHTHTQSTQLKHAIMRCFLSLLCHLTLNHLLTHAHYLRHNRWHVHKCEQLQ